MRQPISTAHIKMANISTLISLIGLLAIIGCDAPSKLNTTPPSQPAQQANDVAPTVEQEKPPLEMTIERNTKRVNLPNMAILTITSLDDELNIDNIVANRGNCTIEFKYPHVLKFGESALAVIHGCTVKEVTVISKDNSYTALF